MKVKVEQLTELHAQIGSGRVSGEALQALIQDAPKLAARRQIPRLREEARKAATASGSKFDALCRVVTLAPNTADIATLRKLVRRDQYQIYDLIRLASATGQSQDFGAAERAIQSVKKEKADDVLTMLVWAYIDWADFGGATACAVRIKSGPKRRYELESILKAQIKAGDKDGALSTIGILLGQLPKRATLRDYALMEYAVHCKAVGATDLMNELRARLVLDWVKERADKALGFVPEIPPLSFEEEWKKIRKSREDTRRRTHDFLELAQRIKGAGDGPFDGVIADARRIAESANCYRVELFSHLAAVTGLDMDIDRAFNELGKIPERPASPIDHSRLSCEIDHLWKMFYENADPELQREVASRLSSVPRAFALSQLAARNKGAVGLRLALRASLDIRSYYNREKCLKILLEAFLDREMYESAIECAEGMPMDSYERLEAFATIVRKLTEE